MQSVANRCLNAFSLQAKISDEAGHGRATQLGTTAAPVTIGVGVSINASADDVAFSDNNQKRSSASALFGSIGRVLSLYSPRIGSVAPSPEVRVYHRCFMCPYLHSFLHSFLPLFPSFYSPRLHMKLDTHMNIYTIHAKI